MSPVLATGNREPGGPDVGNRGPGGPTTVGDSGPARGDDASWRIVRGCPDDVELAALVTVLHAVGRARVSRPSAAPRPWADPRRLVRRTPLAGAGGWHASGLPGA